MSSASVHSSVMLAEAIEGLAVKPGGTYVDGTYGRGGHATAILAALGDDGRLVVVDRDLAAVAHAKAAMGSDPRVSVCHGRFDQLKEVLERLDIAAIDGLLLDLGVSSPQLDRAARGFSFMEDGPLDMRMDQTSGMTVADWLARATERKIADVIFRYGEERWSRQIARAIVQAREETPITTTLQLAEVVRRASPRHDRHKHPATRTFQALRIFINDELGALETVLVDAVTLLAAGGRLVVISFHSLEDRIVKRFLRDEARGEQLPSRLPIRDDQIIRRLRLVGKRVKPSLAEVEINRRARSAVMRVAERVIAA